MHGITPVRYRIDRTGDSPENKVVNEARHIGSNKDVRIIVPRCGAFFTKSLKLFDAQTHKRLDENIDYKCLHLSSKLTDEIGQPIAYMIAIINKNVSPDVYFSHQAVGGMGVFLIPLLSEIIPMLTSEDRIQIWNKIANKPSDFNPGKHYHDAGDFYGFEYGVIALMRIADIIVNRDIDNHGELRAMLNLIDVEFRRRWEEFLNDYNEHLNDKSNPHMDTPYSVNVFTQAEIVERLEGKLAVDDTSVNSERLFGKNYMEFLQEMQSSIHANSITVGEFDIHKLGSGIKITKQLNEQTVGGNNITFVDSFMEPTSGQFTGPAFHWRLIVREHDYTARLYWNGSVVHEINDLRANSIPSVPGTFTEVVGDRTHTYSLGDCYNTIVNSDTTTSYYGVSRSVEISTTRVMTSSSVLEQIETILEPQVGQNYRAPTSSTPGYSWNVFNLSAGAPGPAGHVKRAHLFWNQTYATSSADANKWNVFDGDALSVTIREGDDLVTYFRGSLIGQGPLAENPEIIESRYGVFRFIRRRTFLPVSAASYSPLQVLSNKRKWEDLSKYGSSGAVINFVGFSTEANVKTTFASAPIGTIINWLVRDTRADNGYWITQEDGTQSFYLQHSHQPIRGDELPYISYHLLKTGPGQDSWVHI